MKILGISGSLRKGSFNTLLLRAAQKTIGSGAALEIFDLSKIPLYNADIDGETKPESVQDLLDAVSNSDGLILATPEYNYSVPGVLKNAIDWASRPAFQSVLAQKPAGIISASASPLGGARAQVHLRDVLAGTLTPVFPTPDYLLPSAQNAFDRTGALTDETAERRLKRYLAGFLEWVSRLSTAQGQ